MNIRGAALIALLLGISGSALAQGVVPGESTTTIICFGRTGTCMSWHHAGSNTWREIAGQRVYEDPYPYPMGRTCPEGSDSGDALFIFDPGTTIRSGIGYVGTRACIDGLGGGCSFISAGPGVRVYTSYDEWLVASGEPLH